MVTRVISSPKLVNINQKERYNKYIEDSTCTVQLWKKQGVIKGLWIAFAGSASHFPSVSNSKAIGWINKKGGGKRPTIRKNDSHLAKLSVMTALYGEELIQKGISFVGFDDMDVTVTCLIAEKSGTWDSHNYCKCIGDWLEDVGIINNDSKAEIHCYKKSDYPDFSYPGVTELIIQPRNQVHGLTREHIQQVKQASTGYEYIG